MSMDKKTKTSIIKSRPIEHPMPSELTLTELWLAAQYKSHGRGSLEHKKTIKLEGVTQADTINPLLASSSVSLSPHADVEYV